MLSKQPDASAAEDVQDIKNSSMKRDAAIVQLTQALDESVQQLRTLLDQCYALRKAQPTSVDPQTIVEYAHRLRYAFFPLGNTPGLPMLPPAPQEHDMLASTLQQFRQAQQQQQQLLEQQAAQQLTLQQTQLSIPYIPADWKPGDPIPDEYMTAALPRQISQPVAAAGQTMDQDHPSPVAPTVQQQPSFNLATISFNLNADLGDEVDEEYSEEEYSDDD
eukprot:jgi/Chrzof1/5476/Cz16g04220.t1